MNTKELDIINIEYLKRFEGLKDEFFRLKGEYGIEEGVSINADVADHEYYCECDYLKEMGSKEHIGPPEHFSSVVLSYLSRANQSVWGKYVEEVKHSTAKILGAHTSALALYYPPEGFVGWHTNEDAASYQILFTWSETGDGYFRYRDPETKTLVTLQDRPGWNVRYHYFGNTNEDKLWHCAYTKCSRFSFAYKFIGEESKPLFEMALDEIKT